MTAAAAPAAPMSAVLAQFEAGASSLREVADRTGLDLALVRVVVERLVAMRRLTAEQLTSGCPPDGCGGCRVAGPDGSGCTAGPVLLHLTR